MPLRGNHSAQPQPLHELSTDVKWNQPHDDTKCYPQGGSSLLHDVVIDAHLKRGEKEPSMFASRQ